MYVDSRIGAKSMECAVIRGLRPCICSVAVAVTNLTVPGLSHLYNRDSHVLSQNRPEPCDRIHAILAQCLHRVGLP